MWNPTALALFAALTLPAWGAPVYYISTDHTGAQTQIDIDHSSTWTFTPSTAFEFGGAVLTMKAGQRPTAPVSLWVYEGTGPAGPLLGSATLTSQQFCTQTSNCGNFALHRFIFSTPVVLTVGRSYFAALTSAAVDTQSAAYFIKDPGSSFVADVQGTAVVPQPVSAIVGSGGVAGNFGVPEPSTAVMVALGLAAVLFGAARRR